MAKFEVSINSKKALETYVKDYTLNLREIFCMEEYGENVKILGKELKVYIDADYDGYEHPEFVGYDYLIEYEGKKVCKFFYDTYSDEDLSYCYETVSNFFNLSDEADDKLNIFVVAENIEELIDILEEGLEHIDEQTFWYSFLNIEDEKDIKFYLKFRNNIIDIVCKQIENNEIKTELFLNGESILKFKGCVHYEYTGYFVLYVIIKELENKGLL